MAITELPATTARPIETSKWSPDTGEISPTSASTSLEQSSLSHEVLKEQAALIETRPVETSSPIVEDSQQEFDQDEFLAAEIFRDVPEVKLPFKAAEESEEDEGSPRLYDNSQNFRMWLAALPLGICDEAWDAKNPYRALRKAAFRETTTLTDDEILRQYEDHVVSQTILPSSNGATLDLAARLKNLKFESIARHQHKGSMIEKYPIARKMYNRSSPVEHGRFTNYGVNGQFVIKQSMIDENECANLQKTKIKQMTLLSSRSEINIRSYFRRKVVEMRSFHSRVRNNKFGNRLVKRIVPGDRSTLSNLVVARNDVIVTDQTTVRKNEQMNLLFSKIRRMNLHSPQNRNKVCSKNWANSTKSLAEPPRLLATGLSANDESLYTTYQNFDNRRSASVPAAYELGDYELTPSVGDHQDMRILEYEDSDWHDVDRSEAQNESRVAFMETHEHEVVSANVNKTADEGVTEQQTEEIKRIKSARRRPHVDVEEPQGITYSHDEAC